MNIRFGTIFCLAFSIMAFNAKSIDVEHFNIGHEVEQYLTYMMGDDPTQYVRYFYIYLICRLLKSKLANNTLPLSPSKFCSYLNGSLIINHAELASRLPILDQSDKSANFSLESAFDYSYWVYCWAAASNTVLAQSIILALPSTMLFDNFDLYGLVSGILSTDHRTRTI